MNIYLRLLKFSKVHLSKFILAIICMIVVSAAISAEVFLVKPVLDDIFTSRNATTLKWVTIAIVLVFFIKGVAGYGQNVLMNYIGQRIVTDLRNDLFRHIQTQPLSFFEKMPTGNLIARITSDINLIQEAVSGAIVGLAKDICILIGLIYILFYHDWKLALISLTVFPLTIYPITKFGCMLRGIADSTQVAVGKLTSRLHEKISGNSIVKAFGMEKEEVRLFSTENENLFKLSMRNVSVRAISSPLMEGIGGLGIAGILFYGGYQVIHNASTLGTICSFNTALLMLYEPIKRLSSVNNTIQQGIVGAKRVFDIMDTIPEIYDRKDAIELPPISRGISVKNVSFKYEDSDVLVLKNINLEIMVGQIVAFVGMSGGGKTTLIDLIPRFYDIKTGSIEIDGHDIRDVTLSYLRRQIGIVTQRTVLFNDTVWNNIAYGDRRKPDDAIIRAAKAANAHDFIAKLPYGYDTVIGEQGVKLSGGERQRISIARALLKDAPILILDEATSSLDTEAELEIQGALDGLMKNRTTLVIAHRLSTIKHADRIIVLADGSIVEDGTHDFLLALEGKYFELYRTGRKTSSFRPGI